MVNQRLVVSVVVATLVFCAGCAGTVPAGSGDGPDGSPAERVEVHFINVGQSDAILVVGPNETLLMDTGDFTDDGEVVLEYLKQHDIDRLDYLITSHADADHIGGHAAVIEYFETRADGVGAIYDPGIAASTRTYEEYLDAVETYSVPLYEARAGDTVPFVGATVQILGPPRPYLENRDRNENSLVLKLTHDQTDVLLPGDAEQDQEADLVERYGTRLNATVLRAAHHGSESSSTDAFLDAVSPRMVVITSAFESQYGHPDEVVLDRLSTRQIPTYWTATHGTIVLVSNGTAIEVKSQRAAPTDPRRLRDGEPIEPGTTGSIEKRAVITAGQKISPGVTDGGVETATTPDTDGEIVVERIHADAAGDDRSNLNDEYIVFANRGEETVTLAGWTISDGAGHTYSVPEGVDLEPDATVTLHTGSGENTDTDLYWGSATPIWNNGGDSIVVTNSEGTVVLREDYS